MEALRRFVRGGGDVGAALWSDNSQPEGEGWVFRTVVTDGETFEVVEWIDTEEPRVDLRAGPIETAVEDRIRALCPRGGWIPMLRAFGLWFDEGRIPIRLGSGAVTAADPGVGDSATKAA